MKIFRLLPLLLLALCSFNAKAQNPLISQYYLNTYVLNPSLAGINGNLSALAAYRQDLIGFDNGPQTQMLSFEMPFKEQKFGIGGYLTNSTIGPQRRTAFQASYAYHLRMADDINISFGLGANLWNTGIDFTMLVDDDFSTNDPVLLGDRTSATSFDANAGVTFSTTNFYTSFSALNLISTNNSFDGTDGPIMGNARHFYWLTGFNIPIVDSVWNFEPSFLIKYAMGNSPQADLNARFLYKDFIWFGASYRARYTIVGAVGVKVKEMIDVGYSYDHHGDPINYFGGPSHEVTIKYTLPTKKDVIRDTGTIVMIDSLMMVDSSIAEIDSPEVLIDSAIVQLDSVPTENTYAKTIIKADEAFKSEEWPTAKRLYNDALALKPNEGYPAQQLARIDAIIAAEMALLEEDERKKAEEEAKKREEEERIRAEEAKRKAAAAEEARLKEDAAKAKAAEEAKLKAEEAKAKAAEEAKLKAEEAKRKEEEERRKAAEEAKRIAEENAKPKEGLKTTTVNGINVDQYDESNPYNYVVAGSFGSFANALNFRDDLNSKGFNATIIEHKARGFYRVTLYKSLDSLEADNYKKEMRTALKNPSIWVLEGNKYKKDAVKLEKKEALEEEKAKQEPIIKRSVDVQYKEEKGVRIEILDAGNKFYHVIAGSFGVLDNAVKVKDDLNSKGYEAKILLDKERNLYRVALYSTLDAAEGRAELAKLQNAIDSSLWLLKK